jgi:2-keto-4-pentenoate hydratase/2-oxohepta-3-ene-1,7-dioic acid hydratase in catechol pathway
MAQRYVRVKSDKGQTYYGLLQLTRSIQVLDAPPWLQGQPTDLELEPGSYELLAPCAPTKIVAVGKNYRDHAAEMGTPVPKNRCFSSNLRLLSRLSVEKSSRLLSRNE